MSIVSTYAPPVWQWPTFSNASGRKNQNKGFKCGSQDCISSFHWFMSYKQCIFLRARKNNKIPSPFGAIETLELLLGLSVAAKLII